MHRHKHKELMNYVLVPWKQTNQYKMSSFSIDQKSHCTEVFSLLLMASCMHRNLFLLQTVARMWTLQRVQSSFINSHLTLKHWRVAIIHLYRWMISDVCVHVYIMLVLSLSARLYRPNPDSLKRCSCRLVWAVACDTDKLSEINKLLRHAAHALPHLLPLKGQRQLSLLTLHCLVCVMSGYNESTTSPAPLF